ncbi:MAG TPA: NADPH-dependent F420 reductase [Candidatus Binatia bacterium]|nr:NADPH-dependent F420 reductase [Candidatus Binatia bacterium]
MARYAILGGTGSQGLGLALRLAASGASIAIGSRVAERARNAADKLRQRVPVADATGLENAAAARAAECVILAFPAEGLAASLGALAPELAGKLVVDVMVPLAFRHGRADLAPVDGAPSVAQLVQRALPASRVVSAFKNVPAELLHDLDQPLAGDVLVCGDDADARADVSRLVARLPDLRAVDAGALANARYVEGITALLVNLNRQHRARTSIAIVGLPR